MQNVFTKESIQALSVNELKVLVYDMSSALTEIRRRIDICNEEIQKKSFEENQKSMIQQETPKTPIEKNSKTAKSLKTVKPVVEENAE